MKGRLAVIVLIAIVGLILLDRYSGTETAGPPEPTNTPSITASQQGAQGSLPPEALDTIVLIQSNGPFPYRQDGAVFMNRERRLPIHDRGYWREYTVPTPGESDRGARRLVHGKGDEYYYTDDHYGSFRLVRALELAAR